MCSPNGKQQQQQRAYSLREDEQIIKYVLKSLNDNDIPKLKGNQFWKIAENKKISGRSRSWESLKQRFRAYIMRNIDLYVNIDVDDKSRLKQNYVTVNRIRNKSPKGINRLNIQSAYTEREDFKIITHIIDCNAMDNVNGEDLWKSMEKLGVTGRSWQSMKERYKKRIVPHIYKYRLSVDMVKRVLDSTNWLTVTQRQHILGECERVLSSDNHVEPIDGESCDQQLSEKTSKYFKN